MTAETPARLATAILIAAEPAQKQDLAAALLAACEAAGDDVAPLPPGDGPPDRPARPAKPDLLPPNKMPRRGSGSLRTRVALLHSVAHIELNAIDLAADIIARFGDDARLKHLPAPFTPRQFQLDWARVAADEARHFGWLTTRLGELGAGYGDLPAHDGLWQAAAATTHDLLARLAIVPLVHEARGLDVTPAIADKLRRDGDLASANILTQIFQEEIAHVAAGWRWFDVLCRAQGADPGNTFAALLKQHMPGGLKPPFNCRAREEAGLLPHIYARLTG